MTHKPSNLNTMIAMSLPRLSPIHAALLAALGLMLLSGRAPAQLPANLPQLMSYQGYVADAQGQPLGLSSPAPYQMVFRIFASEGSATTLGSEEQTVIVDKGHFSVMLGQGSQHLAETPLNLGTLLSGPNAGSLYVGTFVKISSDFTEIQPRLRMLPTPYSFLAGTALKVDGAAILSGEIPDARLSDNIRNGPIADNRLSATILSGPITDNRLSDNIRSGPIEDSRLSANIARRNVANTFNGDQNFNGPASFGNTAPADIFGIKPPITLRPSGNIWLGIKDATDANKWHLQNSSGAIDFVETGVASGRLKLDPGGNVTIGGALGIGTAPTAKLHVDGLIRVNQGHLLELGYGESKETNNGTLSYKKFGDKDSLDIVGAGNTAEDRRTRVWGRLQVMQGGWFGEDNGLLPASAGRGVRVMYDNAAGFNQASIYAYNYSGIGSTLPLVLQGPGGNVGIGRKPTTWTLEVEGNASKVFPGDWYANSDARIKRDIHTITGALQTLDRVRLVSHRYREDYHKEHPAIDENRDYLGVIAQEFREVFPDYVTAGGDTLPDGDKILSVDTFPLTIYSAAAIQELNRKVEEQNRALLTENAALKETVQELQQVVAGLQAKEQNRADRLAALESMIQEKLGGVRHADQRQANLVENRSSDRVP